MNRLFITVLATLAVCFAAYAQPAQVKNAAKSTFQLISYDAQGNRISTTAGVFVSANGEAVGAWSALSTAARAEVVDAAGKTYPVQSLIGVNTLYDVCRFKVDAPKTQAATLAATVMPKGTKMWIASASGKNVTAVEYDVERSETFMDKYAYYIFAYNNQNGQSGSPFLTSTGQVAGLLQRSETNLETHAVDARFAVSLTLNALDISNPEYSKTGIRMQLPADKKSAMLMVMLSAEQRDSAKYAGFLQDFIAQFPREVDGYSSSALRRMAYGDYAGADADMRMALKMADNKAEAHSEYARVMYQKLVYDADSSFTAWTLDKALAEAEQAYKLDAQPSYQHRIAQIRFAKGDYSGAYDIFDGLAKTSSFANSEVFFEAAQCKTHLGAKNEEIIALLDSAVAHCAKPYTSVAAPYILSRGQMYDAMKQYRRALADYNAYDTIMLGRADAAFYYTRYKCELNMRQYQQALNDIAHASLAAQPEMRPVYLAEMSSLQLRVNMYDEAITSADVCLRLDPENTDAMIIKGIALITGQKKKDEGMKCLQQAKALGDERADGYIKKYK